MGSSGKVLKYEVKVVVGFVMIDVRIAQYKCTTQQHFHKQHYAPWRVGQKSKDWSVQLGVLITHE